VPLSVIIAVGLFDELLVIVSLPVAAPALVGLKSTFKFVVCPGFRVTGMLLPDKLKPVPATVAALIVTDAAPVELRVTDCATGVFNATLPNETVVALILRMRDAAFNCSVRLLETVPALAVSVTTCAVLTGDAVTVNPALVALAGTVTDAGTLTAPLPPERLTLNPPLGAAPLNVTLQASVADPVSEALLQERALRVTFPCGLVAAPEGEQFQTREIQQTKIVCSRPIRRLPNLQRFA
jgi:hypothetical protein